MGNNLEVLNEWNESLNSYKKLTFEEAKQMYISANNSNNKIEIINEIIMGTLYVVANFMAKNGFIYLNSPSYDMNDVISVCNEIWIKMINAGKILNVISFNDMFDGDFFNNLNDNLGIEKIVIPDNTVLNADIFIDLLMYYIKLKETNTFITDSMIIEYMENNNRYDSILIKLYFFGNNLDFINLFEAIIKSFELDNNDLNITKTKLDKIKYILISNGLEYLRYDINKIYVTDTTELYIDDYCKKQVLEIVLNSDIGDTRKEILIQRYGLLDGRRRTLEEVARYFGVTRACIREKEAKALRLLRHPSRSKKLKALM